MTLTPSKLEFCSQMHFSCCLGHGSMPDLGSFLLLSEDILIFCIRILYVFKKRKIAKNMGTLSSNNKAGIMRSLTTIQL